MPEEVPVHRFSEWERLDPGIVAGITGVADGEGAESDFDFGLVGGGTTGDVTRRYVALARLLGMESIAVARQVHGTRIVEVGPSSEGGVRVGGEADGLLTEAPDILLVVTTADCVPVYVTRPGGQGIAILHAGWRGAAAGILESAIERFVDWYGVGAGDLLVHLGPSICGACYEVGAAVLGVFGYDGGERSTLDLRAELSDRATHAGVPAARVSRSDWCTRCGPVRLHSHRGQGGSAGRMAAFIGRVGDSGSAPVHADGARDLR